MKLDLTAATCCAVLILTLNLVYIIIAFKQKYIKPIFDQKYTFEQ
jgi:hypothetical protein